MKDIKKLIQFDWNIKNIFRDKSNFIITEVFLSTLLNKNITTLKVHVSDISEQSKHLKSNSSFRPELNIENKCITDSISGMLRLTANLRFNIQKNIFECV